MTHLRKMMGIASEYGKNCIAVEGHVGVSVVALGDPYPSDVTQVTDIAR
ncbi:MAG: hypothetical protein WCC22_03280 [Terriglobales bacterium]